MGGRKASNKFRAVSTACLSQCQLWGCAPLVPVHTASNCSWRSGTAILCHWERSNVHDPQAVQVCTLDGTDLGFIPKHLTQRFISDTTFGRVDRIVGPGPQAGGLLGCRVSHPLLYHCTCCSCIPYLAALAVNTCPVYQVTHTCPGSGTKGQASPEAASCIHAIQNRLSCCACVLAPLTTQQTPRQCIMLAGAPVARHAPAAACSLPTRSEDCRKPATAPGPSYMELACPGSLCRFARQVVTLGRPSVAFIQHERSYQ